MADYIRNSTIYKSLTSDPSGPPLQSPRRELDQSLAGMTQPFPRAVALVNQNLGSHGDNTLSQHDATRYTTLSNSIQHSGVSNAYGFGSSALHWLGQGNLTGFAMNTAGFLLAGAYDHSQAKLGRR